MGGNEVEQEHAANIGGGDGDADGLGDDEVDQAQHDGQSAGLAQNAAMDAHEEVQQAQLVGVSHGQRGRGGQLIDSCIREHPLVHRAGEADEQHDTAHQSGVRKVHADAAEQLLDHDDGHEVADEQLTDGHPHRHIQGEDDAGDYSRQVADGVCLLHQLAVQPLERHAGHDRHGSDQQGTQTKDDGRGHDARGQGHDHVGHQAGGRLLRAQVRGGRNNKLRIHYLLPPFLISPR